MQQVGTGYATDHLSCSPSHSATPELLEGNLKMLENGDLVVFIFFNGGEELPESFRQEGHSPSQTAEVPEFSVTDGHLGLTGNNAVTAFSVNASNSAQRATASK
jgi:hypothetical protein